jgi:hypothetical protein
MDWILRLSSVSPISILMQHLFSSFDRGMRIEKTLIQTLASQLSCNSCSLVVRLTGARELRKLSCKRSLLNSHATLVLVWPRHENWENSHSNSRFSTLINSHVTLALVWPGHDSWENSHANSRFSTLMQLLFSFDRGTRIEKTLMQTLASQLSLVNSRFSTLTNVWAGLTTINYLLAVIDYNRNNKHVWAEEHKDVTLSCDINGYPAPVFSWVKNKTVVTTGSRSLTLLHVKQNESCTYECWGNNTLGYNAMLVKLRVASK